MLPLRQSFSHYINYIALHSLFAFTDFLPVSTPHFKLLTLCLKTKHNLPAPISAPASPSSQQGCPPPALLQQPLPFCFSAALSCIPLAFLYTTYIPSLGGFSQRCFTIFLSFLTPTSCWFFCFFFTLAELMAEIRWICDERSLKKK